MLAAAAAASITPTTDCQCLRKLGAVLRYSADYHHRVSRLRFTTSCYNWGDSPFHAKAFFGLGSNRHRHRSVLLVSYAPSPPRCSGLSMGTSSRPQTRRRTKSLPYAVRAVSANRRFLCVSFFASGSRDSRRPVLGNQLRTVGPWLDAETLSGVAGVLSLPLLGGIAHSAMVPVDRRQCLFPFAPACNP